MKRKECPKELIIFDSILVDSFKYRLPKGVDQEPIYALSHFHSDHTVGLHKTWNFGKIICSEITSNLVTSRLGVDKKWLIPLKTNGNPFDLGCGRTASLIDANHCPGAVIFIFQKSNDPKEISDAQRQPEVIVHTGDARFDSCTLNLLVDKLKGLHVKKMFLDTTFCSPEYCLPSQISVEEDVSNIIKKVDTKSAGKCLFLIGTYTIGKERVLLHVAKNCDKKIHVEPSKLELLKLCLSAEDIEFFTTDQGITNVRAVPMNLVSFWKMEELSKQEKERFDSIIGFNPTGWVYPDCKTRPHTIRKRGNSSCTIFGVPYSEHSSFTELCSCVKLLRPDEIVTIAGPPRVSEERIKQLLHNAMIRNDANSYHHQSDIRNGLVILPSQTPSVIVIDETKEHRLINEHTTPDLVEERNDEKDDESFALLIALDDSNQENDPRLNHESRRRMSSPEILQAVSEQSWILKKMASSTSISTTPTTKQEEDTPKKEIRRASTGMITINNYHKKRQRSEEKSTPQKRQSSLLDYFQSSTKTKTKQNKKAKPSSQQVDEQPPSITIDSDSSQQSN